MLIAVALGFLAVYLPIFWDHIPTLVMHKYYCEKEAGFWVYKTLDQWKTENPGVMEVLVEEINAPFTRVGDDENHTDTKILNQRFHWTNEKRHTVSFLPVYRWKFEMLDIENGTVISRFVNFSSGEGRDYLKFWMNNESCNSSDSESIKSSEFTNQFKGAKK